MVYLPYALLPIQIAGIKYLFTISAMSNGRYLEGGGTDCVNQGKKHRLDTSK
jgi:hypothetical protein